MNFAIIGATGNVGRKTIEVLEKSKIEIDNLFLVASEKSAGQKLVFKKKEIIVEQLEKYDFSKAEITIFAAGSEIAKNWAPKASKKTIVIDNSKYFRMDKDVPLVVPEVNLHALESIPKGIIANPNCTTMVAMPVLKPLDTEAELDRIIFSSYQATSGAGLAGVDELERQIEHAGTESKKLTHDGNAVSFPTGESFAETIAYNVVPFCGSLVDDGSNETNEEQKLRDESRKILELPDLNVSATCVRVPVFVGHSEAINIEFEDHLDEDEAREILREAPGIMVIDKREDGGYVTPIECVGDFATFISRIRQDSTIDNGINLWCVSDNLRKGAALNAIQIAEMLLEKDLV